MSNCSTSCVLSQIYEPFPHKFFNRLIDKHQGDHKVRSFSCWKQFVAMSFGQFTFRDSLRDIEISLGAYRDKLYSVRYKGSISRSTLADANISRDFRIYEELGYKLIGDAREMYLGDEAVMGLSGVVYAFDSTTIDLCLKLFPWATFREEKAAIKVHTLLDLSGNIPSFIHISEGRINDVNSMDYLIPEPGATYIFDRAYLDFKRLWRFRVHNSIFVIRIKQNICYEIVTINEAIGENIIADEYIRLTGKMTSEGYPDLIRMVTVYDQIKNLKLMILTNDFNRSAFMIGQLYKARWQVEIFFKWIKGNLKIKRFWGNSINAVKTQVWISLISYLLIAIVKKTRNLDATMAEIMQVVSVMPFEKIDLSQAFTQFRENTISLDVYKQLSFLE